MSWYGSSSRWAPYVPVAKRREKAEKYAAALAKKEKRTLAPVKIDGGKIAKSFWGVSWCENLERYSDYANRLPRGASYARNGSVIDLQIDNGLIKALVSGSEIYKITIKIETLSPAAWKKIKAGCSQSIESLLDLLQGKFDRGIMERLTQKEGGLFPQPKEIQLNCSCPDSAGVCKHIAAVMYGVGNRLDSSPELLFQLRAVDHLELIGAAVSAENLTRSLASDQDDALAGSDLGELFGIELDVATVASDETTKPVKKVGAVARKRVVRQPVEKSAGKWKTPLKSIEVPAVIEPTAVKPVKKSPKLATRNAASKNTKTTSVDAKQAAAPKVKTSKTSSKPKRKPEAAVPKKSAKRKAPH